ncbi:MAG: Ig-like domain-containing protein, partial [Muribaculaceae bacterium]|nr:Ig-like domain-containing protein [Muribaculaceae bacterium]
MADEIATGEHAWLPSGEPANEGQSTMDHIFVRGSYDDTGTIETYDNTISFKSGALQQVWFYLDDDEIYLNETIQSLTPIAYNSIGDLYNEITYHSFQCDIYVPQGLAIVETEDGQGNGLSFVRGERMPTTTSLSWIKQNDTKVIDGKTYDIYTVVCYNTTPYGSHLSARNATMYRLKGALKKDATLFSLYLENQNNFEDRVDDIIISNIIMTFREAYLAGWDSNQRTFFYGEGGDCEEQRFMRYNRVAVYGSKGMESSSVLAESVELNQSAAVMTIGQSLQLAATVLPDETTNKTVAWSSSDPSVAKVDQDGLVTALKAGNTMIIATTTDGSNLSASCAVTVNNVLASSVIVTPSSLTLDIGESSQMTATVFPANTTDKTVTWTSDNPAIATVSVDGVVTAVSPGVVNITATTADGSNLSATCAVTVNNVLASSVIVTPSSLTLDIGESSQVTATVYPANTTDKTVTWTSDNPAIATVSVDGVVTAVSPGTVNITATTTDGSNLSATCKVTVNERQATSIVLDKSSLSLYVSQTSQLTATVYPADTGNKTVAWTSSNPSVATVDQNGLVTALVAGNATITATTTDGSDLSATCAVTVNNMLATSITVAPSSLTLDMDQSYQLTATVYPANTTNKAVTWTSSDPAIATVSSDGVVTAVSPGIVNITATTADGSNLSATCKVTVNERIATGITMNKTSLSLYVSQTSQLTATVYPADTGNKTVAWTSSDPSVATVDQNGLVTALVAGNATITATTTDGSNLSATCAVTVNNMLANSITVAPSSLTLDMDQSYQLTATVYPANTTNKAVTWKSSDPAIATVSSDGVVTAVSPGIVNITATTADGSNLSATCKVTVNERIATGITLNKSSLSLYVSQTSQLTATVYPADTGNKTVAWTSSDPSVATVDQNGLVTALAAGNATITATTTDGSDLSAMCVVTVNNMLASSVIVTPSSLTLDMDESYQLTATVYPANTTNKAVTWKSSDPAIATVSSDGVVTAVSPGIVNITATTADGSNLSATCKVIVNERIATGITLNKSSLSLYVSQTFQLTATVYPADTGNKTVAWTSSDPSVATVDQNGLVTALVAGNATITATTTDGSDLSATCAVTVNNMLATSIT